MGLQVPGPGESIYLWMYKQGVSGTNMNYLLEQLRLNNKPIRQKDIENYMRGLSNHKSSSMFNVRTNDYYGMGYSDYPEHPNLIGPDITKRWVPCSASGMPLIKWSEGCMSKIDAMCMLNSKSLAENLRATRMIVIDCDGDHAEGMLDFDTIRFLSKYMTKTHCLMKPKTTEQYGLDVPKELRNIPASFHLTFYVTKIIPTMHFPHCHIDIVGNRANSLRYLKNKVWNNLPPIQMTDEIWDDIKGFIQERL